MLFDYDDRDEQSILKYAKRLEGKTFKDIQEEYNQSSVKYYVNPNDKQSRVADSSTEYNVNSNAKGQLGNFLERYYFGYMPNGEQEADFSNTGIELKQTCVDKKKNGQLTAGERLSITNISYNEPVEDDFYKSHVWDKIRLILLIHYLRDRTIDRMDYQILFANLFTPTQEDLKIIIEDYNKINEKIKAGKAHELSESDTLYLGACTKGATAAKSTRPQFYGNHTPARKRNFCFKRQYMDYVLHHYVLQHKVPYESILANSTEHTLSFEDYVLNCINRNIGKTDEQLCKLLNREYNNNKAQWIDLAYRMLGIKNSKAEEFIKANIVVKTIRIEENGKNKESISLPPFRFMDLINQTWEESEFCEYFETTRFLFVVYKKEKDRYVLKGAKMWNMPYEDLNITCKEGWEHIKKVIKGGVILTPKRSGEKIIYLNNLPKKADNPIMHIRPHAQKAAFKLKDGTIVGNLTNANELPDGQWMTTQSFWLNNDYVLNQLKK